MSQALNSATLYSYSINGADITLSSESLTGSSPGTIAQRYSMLSQNLNPVDQTLGYQGTMLPADTQGETGPWTKDLNSHLPAISKCPVEILTEIFVGYLEEKGCQIEHLLFVCRRWYLLLIDSPLFWTKINISISTPIQYVAPSQIRFVEIFIQRSNGMLLDIEVNCSDVMRLHTSNTWRNYGPALNLLAGNMYRCRTLHVMLPWDITLSGMVCSLFKGPAPNMVELSIRYFAYRSSQAVSFSELPRLRILEIDGYALKQMISSHRLAMLHSLDLDLLGFSTWNIFRGISNWTADVSLLRSLCSLQLRYNKRTETSAHPRDSIRDPISLPLLENLGLWGLEKLELQFELPALRSLTFDGAQFPKVNPEEVIWRSERRNSNVEAAFLLKTMIIQYRSAKTFVLPAWTKELLAVALQMMRDQGSVKDDSVAFVTGTQDGEREQI